MPRVVSAKRRVKTLQRRVRRGRMTKSRPARVTLKPEAARRVGERTRGTPDIGDIGAVEDWSPVAAGEMVRLVVTEAVALGVMKEGVKRQAAPEGRPPVQAKVMVE
jgi:hypothetical protein